MVVRECYPRLGGPHPSSLEALEQSLPRRCDFDLNIKPQVNERNTPTKAKKLKATGRVYQQRYRRAYTEEWPCIQPSKWGNCFARCTVCNRDLSVKAGGRDDCHKLINTKQHADLARAVQSTPSASTFVTDKDSNVTKAERLFTHFLVEHNVPISVSDHGPALVQGHVPRQ